MRAPVFAAPSRHGRTDIKTLMTDFRSAARKASIPMRAFFLPRLASACGEFDRKERSFDDGAAA